MEKSSRKFCKKYFLPKEYRTVDNFPKAGSVLEERKI
jgi:hypothetical protein